MNEIVQQFLADQKERERKKYEEEKKITLFELGLYKKVYSPDNKHDWEYSITEWDPNTSTRRYYKKVPLEITDEEYQEVCKYTQRKEVKKINAVAKALEVIAWVLFIGGFIAGIALGRVEVERGYYYTYTETEFSFAAALIYWSVSLISGTVFLGFAEIIKLLDAIKKK